MNMKRYVGIILLVGLIVIGCAPAKADPPPETPIASADLVEPDAGALPSTGAMTNLDPKEKSADYAITPIEEIHTTGKPVQIDIEEYRLVVDGAVVEQLALSRDELLALRNVTEGVILTCPGFFVDNAIWSGVPLGDILERAGLDPAATKVKIRGADDYQVTIPLDAAMQDGTFLAYAVNGEELPEEHGFPLRLVVKGAYGAKWVKWVARIEVLAG